MNTQSKHSRGFTVVELVMAMAVGLVLLAAISTAVVSGQRSSTGIERKVTTNQDARAALEIMASEIRMASYNSLFAGTGRAAPYWLNQSTACAGNQIYRGIQEATATSITIEMDIGTPHWAGGNAARTRPSTGPRNEIIRYEYDNVNQDGSPSPATQAPEAQRPCALLSFLGPITGQPEVRTVRRLPTGHCPFFDTSTARRSDSCCDSAGRHSEYPAYRDRAARPIGGCRPEHGPAKADGLFDQCHPSKPRRFNSDKERIEMKHNQRRKGLCPRGRADGQPDPAGRGDHRHQSLHGGHPDQHAGPWATRRPSMPPRRQSTCLRWTSSATARRASLCCRGRSTTISRVTRARKPPWAPSC